MTTDHITQTMANPEIIAELGRRFKEYRLTYRLTQKEVAEKAGVCLVTLRQFENGKAYNINMGNFLALLRVVDCLEQMDDLLPQIPVSAYTMEKIMNKKPKRIRHGKYYCECDVMGGKKSESSIGTKGVKEPSSTIIRTSSRKGWKSPH